MICDALENLNRYRGLHKNLETAIDYLTAYHVAHDLSDLPLGRTEVDGENVFINVMEAGLNPDSARLEYHKKYADLQIDLTGGEGWGYTNLTGEEAGTAWHLQGTGSDLCLRRQASGSGPVQEARRDPPRRRTIQRVRRRRG